jgi:hypothetical protein
MWILDVERSSKVAAAQLYLTVPEARRLRDALIELLDDPDASVHRHIGSEGELSVSIITDRKLDSDRWTLRERQLLFDNR